MTDSFANLDSRFAARRQCRPRRRTARGLFEAEVKRVRKMDRVCAAVMEFWAEIDLPHLEAVLAMQYKGGILTVTVPNKSIAFMFDREMRCGVEAETVKRTPATLSRIKFVLGG